MGINWADTNALVNPNRSWIDPMPILMPAAAQKLCKQVTMMPVRGSKTSDNLLHLFMLFTSLFCIPVQKKTRIDVYETLCPQQMLVHKGGKIKNWVGECRDVTPTKSLSQKIRVDVNREVKFL